MSTTLYNNFENIRLNIFALKRVFIFLEPMEKKKFFLRPFYLKKKKPLFCRERVVLSRKRTAKMGVRERAVYLFF